MATTLSIPACVFTPSVCANTSVGTLTSIGASTPATGFALLSKNVDNSFTIAMSSNDLLIAGLTYQFQMAFTDSSVVSVTQPVTPTFLATIVNPCLTTTLALPTTLVATSITSLSGLTSTQVFAPATDTAAISAAISDLCGPSSLYNCRDNSPGIRFDCCPSNQRVLIKLDPVYEVE